MKIGIKALVATLVLSCAQQVQAYPLEFTAALSGANEFPSNASPAIGSTSVFYDPDAHTLQVNYTFSGLLGNTTAAHIHCCTALPFGNSTAGVATQTPTFINSPLGVNSGIYNSPIFDLTLTTSWNNAFINLNGGTTAGAEAAFSTGLFANKSYLNVHSTSFPGGEIRGFLVFVPEPMTLSLFGAGLGGLAILRRRRKLKPKS